TKPFTAPAKSSAAAAKAREHLYPQITQMSKNNLRNLWISSFWLTLPSLLNNFCHHRKEPSPRMTYVVVELCVDCKYTDCAAVCPVEAFHELPDRLYINADTCIDCD